MPTQSPWRFQFDRTGVSPTNKIIGEVHLFPTANHLPKPLKEGLFFTESVIVLDKVSNTVMTKGIDYIFVGMDAWAFSLTGNEVATAIEIKDKTRIGDIEVTYQCVGGAEGQPIGILQELLDAIQTASASSTIDWKTDIGNLPVYFPPAPHRHALSQLEEIELLTNAFREVHNALINRVPLIDSGNSLQEQVDRIIRVLGELQESVQAISAVTGAASQIASLKTKIDDYHKFQSHGRLLTAGNTVLLATYDLNTVGTVRGNVTFTGLAARDMLDFSIACMPSTVPSVGIHGKVYAGADVLSVTAVRVGTELRIMALSGVDGAVAAKIYCAL